MKKQPTLFQGRVESVAFPNKGTVLPAVPEHSDEEAPTAGFSAYQAPDHPVHVKNVLPGQTVCMLLKTDRVKVKIPVPENEIATIAPGCPARITVAALNDREYRGEVAEKGASANPVSHTYEVRIPLSNSDGRLMPGMVCRVTLQGDTTAQAVVLPNRAVQVTGRGERFVWCVQQGRAVRVPVTVGKLTRDGVVITRGLTPGDRVVTDGTQKISDGMKVEVL